MTEAAGDKRSLLSHDDALASIIEQQKTGKKKTAALWTCSTQTAEATLLTFRADSCQNSTRSRSSRSPLCPFIKFPRCCPPTRYASHWEDGSMAKVFPVPNELPPLKNLALNIRKYQKMSSTRGSTLCTLIPTLSLRFRPNSRKPQKYLCLGFYRRKSSTRSVRPLMASQAGTPQDCRTARGADKARVRALW